MKSKKKVKSKISKVSKEIQYLEKIWRLSVANINGYSEAVDLLFTEQAKTIRSEIKKLQGKQ